MSFYEHSLFTDPEETDILWRYMDFTKFVSILSTKSLFFPSARILQKIDPWEGTYLKKELDFRLKEDLWMRRNPKLKYKYGELNDNEILKEITESWKHGFENQIDINYISCWHYNSIESAAMWRLYLKSNEGICIQTDINSFKESFEKEQKSVFIGMVRYKDYGNDSYYTDYDMKKLRFAGFNMFLPFIHKRKIYEHEKEYRAIVPINDDSCKDKSGILIKVNLIKLIKRIILAPSCPEWFEDLVRATIKKYDFDFEICNSIVDDKPYEYDLSPYQHKNKDLFSS
ncbi:MAG: DUF2971 domain-containing protein [Candidatus Kapaibacterium sp.]